MNVVLLIYITVYLLVSVVVIGFVIKSFKRYRAALLFFVAVALLAMPMLLAAGNYFLGKGLYEEYCGNASGLKLYKEIERVDSLYVMESKPYSYLAYGFGAIETEEEGRYVKYFIEENTSGNCHSFDQEFLKARQCVAKVTVELPKSRYALKSEELWETVTRLLHVRHSPVLYERESGEAVAALVDFRWDQGWMASLTGVSVRQCLASRHGKFMQELMSVTVGAEE